MTIYTSWFTTEPDLGINFNNTYSGIVVVPSSVLSTGNIDQSAQLVAPDSLGTYREGTNNSHWVLVKASSTITQFNLISFDDAFNANNFTTALGLSGGTVAICQFQNFAGQTISSADPSTNPVFWAAVRGVGMQANVSGSAGTGVAVNTGTVAGSLSVSSTGTSIAGLAFVVSAGASGVVEININYPKLRTL